MSRVNRTWPIYVPTQHLSFAQKLGSHRMMGGGGGGECGQGAYQKKSINKCNEINKISTLTSHKNSLQNAIKIGVFYCHP